MIWNSACHTLSRWLVIFLAVVCPGEAISRKKNDPSLMKNSIVENEKRHGQSKELGGRSSYFSHIPSGYKQDRTVPDSRVVKRSALPTDSERENDKIKRENRRLLLIQRYRLFRKKKMQRIQNTETRKNEDSKRKPEHSYETNDLPTDSSKNNFHRTKSSPHIVFIEKQNQRTAGFAHKKTDLEHTVSVVKTPDVSTTPRNKKEQSPMNERNPKHINADQKRFKEKGKKFDKTHQKRNPFKPNQWKIPGWRRVEKTRDERDRRKKKKRRERRKKKRRNRYKQFLEMGTPFTTSTFPIIKDIGHRPTDPSTYNRRVQRFRTATLRPLPLTSIDQMPRERLLSEMTTLTPFISQTQAFDYFTKYDYMKKPKRWPARLVLPVEGKPDFTSEVKDDSLPSLKSYEIMKRLPLGALEGTAAKDDLHNQLLKDSVRFKEATRSDKQRNSSTRQNRKRNRKNRKRRRKKKKRRRHRKKSKWFKPTMSTFTTGLWTSDSSHITSESDQEMTTTNMIKSTFTSVDTTTYLPQNMEDKMNSLVFDVGDQGNNSTSNETMSSLDTSTPSTSSVEETTSPLKNDSLSTVDFNDSTSLTDNTNGSYIDKLLLCQLSNKSDQRLDLNNSDPCLELENIGNVDSLNDTNYETHFSLDANFTETESINSSFPKDSSTDPANGTLSSTSNSLSLQPNESPTFQNTSATSTTPIDTKRTTTTSIWSSEMSSTPSTSTQESSYSFETSVSSTTFQYTSTPSTTNVSVRKSGSSARSRWRQWARKRRKRIQKKKKQSSISIKQTKHSVVKIAPRGSVAGSLITVKTEQQTLKPTSRSPFVTYKTAYDFLSKQKGIRNYGGNERRREAAELNQVMAENMCEIFDKHFVPTSIGGKCA